MQRLCEFYRFSSQTVTNAFQFLSVNCNSDVLHLRKNTDQRILYVGIQRFVVNCFQLLSNHWFN